MVVKTDGYSEFGAHMYILSAQIYISRKFEKNSKKTYSSKRATCSEPLEYNTTLFVCGYLCVCVCVCEYFYARRDARVLREHKS